MYGLAAKSSVTPLNIFGLLMRCMFYVVLSIEMISNSRCLDTMGYKVVLFLQSSGVTVGSLAFKENIARWYVLKKSNPVKN